MSDTNWEMRDIARSLEKITKYLRFHYYTVTTRDNVTEVMRVDREDGTIQYWDDGDEAVGLRGGWVSNE